MGDDSGAMVKQVLGITDSVQMPSVQRFKPLFRKWRHVLSWLLGALAEEEAVDSLNACLDALYQVFSMHAMSLTYHFAQSRANVSLG